MKRSEAAVFFNIFVSLVSFAKGSKEINTTSASFAAQHDEFTRQRRSFGNSGQPCGMTHGVYLERWDRIDYKRVRFLYADPRYPTLPSLSLCVPTFEQPQKWSDFFGARIRTYFSPLQTGNHLFYLSSNAGSKLFISKDDKAKDKTMICDIDGGFPTLPYEYDRYSNQKSLPVDLEKGKFYYMESVMKDDHQYDHLEVGMKTPDGTFYKVIPSTFLWTTTPVSLEKNVTYRAFLLRVAAEAGAKAGSSFGAKSAMRSGFRAGAKAGALAGMEAGASAGATAGVRAAINITKQTIQDALNNLHGDRAHKFKINIEDGEVVSVTGPGMETSGGAAGGAVPVAGAAAAAGTAGTTGTVVATGSTSSSSGSTATAGSSGGAGTGGGAGGSVTGAGSSGQEISGTKGTGSVGSVKAGAAGSTAAGSESVRGQTGVTGSSQVTSSGGIGGVGVGRGGGGGNETSEVYLQEYSLNRKLTYIPKPGEDPQVKAKEYIWRAGGARRIVANGLYTFHSFNIPFPQEDFSLNQCWRSINGKFVLDQWCNVFVARIPSLYANLDLGGNSVSFESACFPGHFMRQKNYHFLLQKRDGSDVFDRDSSFQIFSVMKFARNLLFNSWHQDWYICQSEDRKDYGTKLILDFYNGEPDVLDRCTFILNPFWKHKYQNCKYSLGPVEAPGINGQPLPHPPHLIEKTPASPVVLPSCIPMCPVGTKEATTQAAVAIPSTPEVSIGSSPRKKCVTVNFTNKFGSPFTLYSSLKHEGYFVTRSAFKLQLITDRPDLHSYVTFFAKDPEGKRLLLLNGSPSISEPLVSDCAVSMDVIVTAKPGLLPANTTQTSPVLPKAVAPPSLPTAPATVSPPAPKGPSTQAPLVSPSPPKTEASTSSSPSDNGTVHFHYHFHDRNTPVPVNVCPSSCIEPGQCQPSCPIRCCNRSIDEYIDEDKIYKTRKRDCICARKCAYLSLKRNTRKEQCILSCSRSCRRETRTSRKESS
ncbi:uncharacterized protein [Montipora foliosa]|uniref:uncharacterized protein n=1 Tax=Montipora foliosa TaxID=591990 RepID=UPI0035F1A5CB